MGYLLRDKYARRAAAHECNAVAAAAAAAVRSTARTHERERTHAHTQTAARRAFIKCRTYGARVRAIRRLRRRHFSSTSPPFLGSFTLRFLREACSFTN